MSIDIYEIIEGPNDILIVNGVVDGVSTQARGWISAITNHFDSASYDAKGERNKNAVARRMNDAEILAYAESLLAPVVVVDVEAPTFNRISVAGMKARPIDTKPIDVTPIDVGVTPNP